MLHEVKAEMTGTVWKIVIEEGQKVTEEDTLLVLESMKMEIPLLSPVSGVIKEIKVNEGDVVQEGDVIIYIETL